MPNFHELLNAFQSEYLHIIYFDDKGGVEVDFLGNPRQMAPVVLTNVAATIQSFSSPGHIKARRDSDGKEFWWTGRNTTIQRGFNKVIGLQHFLILGGGGASHGDMGPPDV